MRVSFFSTESYDRQFFDAANARYGHEITYLEPRLTPATAFLASGSPVVCLFINDVANEESLRTLAEGGTRLVALRSAGFSHVDLEAASELGLTVVRVPAYSPEAVAEHTVALMLALARRIPRAFNRVREGNFELEGLLGFDLHGKTIGIVGTGRIGVAVARVLKGFGCRLIAYDVDENAEAASLGVEYVSLEELYEGSDVVTLHCPLVPATYHLIDAEAVGRMRDGVMMINTSRGQVIDTPAVIDALKTGKIGYLGLDVYEEEGDLFFRDLSNQVMTDDVFARLLTFPNVVITAHQAFFTQEALTNIAETTLANISAFESGQATGNEVALDHVAG